MSAKQIYIMSSGVEFEEDKFNYTPQRPAPGGFSAPPSFGGGGAPVINRNDPKMVQWLMKKGFATTPAAAQGILIIIILINIAITYFIISYIL
jgi:hypothetical protein